MNFENKIEKAIDLINNFDEKNINIIFLVTVGRAGEVLLQTLFDNHNEIINIPFPMMSNLYNQLIIHERKYKNFDIEIVRNMFLYRQSHGYLENLGKDKNEKIDLNIELISYVFDKIIKEVSISRKNIILTCALSYSIVHNIDFIKAKAIFFHHHHFLVIQNCRLYVVDD